MSSRLISRALAGRGLAEKTCGYSTIRAFHKSSVAFYKTKLLDHDGKSHYSGDNKFKQGTPKRTAGPIDDFMKTASYSRAVKLAVAVPGDAQGGVPYDLGNLETGRVFQYPVESSKRLAKLGSFQRGQGNELFKEHCVLLRQGISTKILESVEKGSEKSSKDNRLCIIGDSGVGKSSTLAQAHAFAAEKGYVVLAIPRAEDLIDGNSDALFSKKHNLFIQSMLAKRWMKKVARANKQILSQIKPSEAVIKSSGAFQPHSSSAMKSLYNFLIEGKNRRDAFEVLNDFVTEVSNQSVAPVLLTMDNVNAITDRVFSVNRDTQNRPIKALDLQLPKIFFDFLSGERSLTKGLVIAATSGKFSTSSTITAGLGLSEAPSYASRKEYDYELAAQFKGVAPLEVQRLNQTEANALLDYFHASKLFSEELTDNLRHEKYFLSGNGNPRSLLKACTPISF